MDEGIYVQIILTNLMCMRDFLSSSGERVSLEEAQLFLRSPFDRALFTADMGSLRDQVEDSVEAALQELQGRDLKALWDTSDLESFLQNSSAVDAAAKSLGALRVFTKEERLVLFLQRGKALVQKWLEPRWDAIPFTDLEGLLEEVNTVMDDVREVSAPCSLHSAMLSRLRGVLSAAEAEVDRRRHAWSDVIAMHDRCVKGNPCSYEELASALTTALQSQVSDADVVEKVQELLGVARAVEDTVRSAGYGALEVLLDKLAAVLDCPSTLGDVIEKLAALPLGRTLRSSLKRNFEASGYIESARDVLLSADETLRRMGFLLDSSPNGGKPALSKEALEQLEGELDLHCRAIAKSLSDAEAFNRNCRAESDAVLTVPGEVLSAAADVHRRCEAFVVATRSISLLKNHATLEEAEGLVAAWEGASAAVPDEVLHAAQDCFMDSLRRSRALREIMRDILSKYEQALTRATESYSALLDTHSTGEGEGGEEGTQDGKEKAFREEHREILLEVTEGLVSTVSPLRTEINTALATLREGLTEAPLVESALRRGLLSLPEYAALVDVGNMLGLLVEVRLMLSCPTLGVGVELTDVA